MINLIKNELIKIFSKKSIYIMLTIIFLVSILTNVIYKYKLDENGNIKTTYYKEKSNDTYLEVAKENYEKYSDILKNTDKNSHEYKEYKSIIEVNKYILDNKINTNKINDTRGILINLFTEYELFLIILIVMIVGTIISEEFNKGTIKQMLIKPYTRIQILLSKYITSIIVILFSIVVLILFQLILGFIFKTLSTINVPVAIYNISKSKIETYNVFNYLLIIIVNKLPMFILIMTFVFLVGIITLNSQITITLGLMLYIISSIFNVTLLNISLKISQFLITTNWDFTTYLFGIEPKNIYLSLDKSLATCIIYLLFTTILSFVIFNKKEVKNI